MKVQMTDRTSLIVRSKKAFRSSADQAARIIEASSVLVLMARLIERALPVGLRSAA
jgi:hypothetical protein